LSGTEFIAKFHDLAIERQTTSRQVPKGYAIFSIDYEMLCLAPWVSESISSSCQAEMIDSHIVRKLSNANPKYGEHERFRTPIRVPRVLIDDSVARAKVFKAGATEFYRSKNLVLALEKLCRYADYLIGFHPDSDEWKNAVGCQHELQGQLIILSQ
jgi:hypothetical protein